MVRSGHLGRVIERPRPEQGTERRTAMGDPGAASAAREHNATERGGESAEAEGRTDHAVLGHGSLVAGTVVAVLADTGAGESVVGQADRQQRCREQDHAPGTHGATVANPGSPWTGGAAPAIIRALMDLHFTAEEESFRAEVRDWLAGADAPAWEDPDLDIQVARLREWQGDLAAAKLVGVHWPAEYGGRGLSWTHNFVVQMELAAARAPEILNRIGVNLVGPTLMAHGTDAQKSRWLPAILPAQELWCQLFSEPGAGSDLASLMTRAERSDGGWVVNGQKVWSSYAQYARWGYLLARTDAGAAPHRGITAMVVDMEAPGIEVRPLVQLTGEAEFNEVFLTDVEVPDEAVIGAPGEGWTIAGTTLTHERGTSPRQLVVHTMLLDEMLRRGRDGGGVDDPALRGRLARAYADLVVFRLHNYRTLTDLARTGSPGPAATVVKLFWSEMSQRMHETALALLGPSVMAEPDDADAARIVRNALYYRAATIFAGTSEIQRNVIGERTLGLPREPRAQRD